MWICDIIINIVTPRFSLFCVSTPFREVDTFGKKTKENIPVHEKNVLIEGHDEISKNNSMFKRSCAIVVFILSSWENIDPVITLVTRWTILWKLLSSCCRIRSCYTQVSVTSSAHPHCLLPSTKGALLRSVLRIHHPERCCIHSSSAFCTKL